MLFTASQPVALCYRGLSKNLQVDFGLHPDIFHLFTCEAPTVCWHCAGPQGCWAFLLRIWRIP